jgi:hypothetical protein
VQHVVFGDAVLPGWCPNPHLRQRSLSSSGRQRRGLRVFADTALTPPGRSLNLRRAPHSFGAWAPLV